MPYGRTVLVLITTLLVALRPPVSAQEPPTATLLIDVDMTPAAGATDLLAMQRAVSGLEDRVLPIRFTEATPLRRALGIGYRFGKWFALDLPQDHFLMVVAHEVYGHGSRLREIGARHIHYGFDPPIPYGGGGAVTEFSGELLVTRADVLAIDTAGIEAQSVLADRIGRVALARGTMSYREAWLYFESLVDGVRYIRSVSPRSPEGHDPADFLKNFAEDCEPPACVPIDAATLKRRALWTFADPVLAYAVYGFAVSYVSRGHSSFGLPMIPLRNDAGYLPAVRFAMTPYGTEWATEHTIVHRRRLTRASVRFGDTGHRRAWGVGLLATDAVTIGGIALQFSTEVWRQPPLGAPPQSRALATGGLAEATANVPVGRRFAMRRVSSLVLQGGYKSDGFVRGERLHRGPILRVGLTVRLP